MRTQDEISRDDIIEMARQAGIIFGYPAYHDRIEAFAKLVADVATAKEREACAKVCDELPWKDMTQIPSNLAFAAAIRARGEPTSRGEA